MSDLAKALEPLIDEINMLKAKLAFIEYNTKDAFYQMETRFAQDRKSFLEAFAPLGYRKPPPPETE